MIILVQLFFLSTRNQGFLLAERITPSSEWDWRPALSTPSGPKRLRKSTRQGLYADFNAMARLLAKTAYAYRFAEFGGVRAGYRPLILGLIAGLLSHTLRWLRAAR
jgi:hypothetical protein